MRRTYTVPIGTFVVLGVFSLGLALLLVLAPLIYSVPPPSALKVLGFTAFAFGFPAAIFLWLSRFQLAFSPDSLIYSSLFAGRHTIRLADIVSCRLVSRSWQANAKWIEIETADRTLAINYRVFSREAQHDLFSLIRA